MAKKKTKKEWVHVGNYLLATEKNRGGEYLVCKTLSNNWSIRWRSDSMMYGLLLSLMEEPKTKDYLHTLITLQYVATTYPHDLVSIVNNNGEMPFHEGFAKLIHEQNVYESSVNPKLTEAEDAEELEKVRKVVEVEEMVREELRKVKDGVHGTAVRGREGIPSQED